MMTSSETSSGVVSPSRLAHVVLRSGRYDAVVNWYKKVLHAEPSFESEGLTFLRYDDEHHRVAVLNMPGLQDPPDNIAGVHHIAFTYDRMVDLIENYERLKADGIEPALCINHGPTTSMYYVDPDGNKVELQIDNYDTVEEAGKFFFTPEFAENPIGVEFDPDDLLRRFRAGEPIKELGRRPNIGAQSLADVKKIR
jgi:catechol 2,3-dioxygenase-like lactoylglutathione lyase family enzyme